MIMPGRGFLGTKFTESYPTVMSIGGDDVVLPSGTCLPMNSSMGLVATTPIYPEETASDRGPYGGDIDMEELVEGNTLFLPVFMPGILLTMDDATPWSAMAQWPEAARGAPPAPMSMSPRTG